TDWTSMATVVFSDSDISIDGSGCSNEDGVLYITEGGEYTLTGESNACSIVINTDENVKLILNGVELTSTNGPVIYGAQVKNLYIELADGTTNTLTDSTNYETDSNTGEVIGKGVISCEDDLIILGEGTLNINANYKHGIVSDDKLYIESGTINVNCSATDGLHANDLICVDGGTLYIVAPSDMIESEDMLVINDGTITGSSDDEGLEAKGNMYINGGTIDIETTDDTINAGSYIEINGGDISLTATVGDAIDCNGNYDGCITINGGNLVADGGSNPEGGIDADNSAATINGGEIIIVGDVNSPLTEDGSQIAIVYGSFNAGETIDIIDSDGATVFTTTPEASGTTMIISSSAFESNETYTITANGSEVMTVTTDSQVVEAGGSASGMMGGMGQGQMPGGQMPDGEMPSGEMPKMNGGPGGNFGQNKSSDNL
nr:carbohydrate-binding domain-containing protein [Pseudobutyrivibrio sp.]